MKKLSCGLCIHVWNCWDWLCTMAKPNQNKPNWNPLFWRRRGTVGVTSASDFNWSVEGSNPIKDFRPVVTFRSKKINHHCLVLVDFRNGFQHEFHNQNKINWGPFRRYWLNYQISRTSLTIIKNLTNTDLFNYHQKLNKYRPL